MARTFGATNKDRPFRAAIVRELRIADGDPEKLDAIAKSLVDQATSGDLQAIREIADRLDGKPAQAIEHSGELNVKDMPDDELGAMLSAVRAAAAAAPREVVGSRDAGPVTPGGTKH